MTSLEADTGTIDMTEAIEKPKAKPRAKKKPPTQTAGVGGIDAHQPMGAGTPDSHVNWFKLVGLPAFEMFVLEQSGQDVGNAASDWVKQRRATLSDSVLYDQYTAWHKAKGLWVNETPTGAIK